MSSGLIGLRLLPFTDGDLEREQVIGGVSAGGRLPRIPAGPNSRWHFDPAGAPSGALAGAGAGNVDNGDHKLLVVFVMKNGTTEAGTLSAAVTVADKAVNGKIAWSAIPTGPANYCYQRKLYRTKVGAPSGTAYLLATLDDNTTTTYTDNTADAGLGAAAPSTNTANKSPALRYPRQMAIVSDIDARLVWGVGSTPTAVAGSGGRLLKANQQEILDVPEDATHYAGIADDGASAGTIVFGYTALNVDRL